jgi:TRAP-type mannitol/chloroaromatic compound transport system permease large subunit
MSGLWMFAVALVLMLLTGWPVYAVLLFVATLFASGAWLLGHFDPSLIGALPNRIVGLLEHDLLQALPLYALIGALLNRLPLATQLHRCARWLVGGPAASDVATLGVGALLAPMNGSVGASLHTLSRCVPALENPNNDQSARNTATLCVASTLGLVIPPSLVLLLLGDTMMRAHTEAVNVTRAMVQIVNTQDVMRAALIPGGLVFLLSIAWVVCRGRGTSTNRPATPPSSDFWTALCVVFIIAGLLVGVAIGRFYAVEAAATGAMLLVVYGVLSGQLSRTLWRGVLRDSLTLTGLLFALLIGATAFSLVLRGLGTDVWVAEALRSWSDHPQGLLLLVLLGLMACSFVLDAFEMIFLVIPLVIPPVLQVVPDAAWVATLVLLVLQTGFLLPPFGYAVVMARAMSPHAPRLKDLSRALLPHVLIQLLLIGLVFSVPAITQLARGSQSLSDKPALTNDQVEEAMRQTTPSPYEAASAPDINIK